MPGALMEIETYAERPEGGLRSRLRGSAGTLNPARVVDDDEN
jgi:hypothetical protein